MSIIDSVKKEAQKLSLRNRGCHKWDHTERVYSLCMHIGKMEKADLEVLAVSSFLHDIGRSKQDDSNGLICHAEVGAKTARKILKKYNLKKEFIENVVHSVETHRFKNKKEPKTLEAKILYDADKLDSIGAVGVGRAFLFAGEIGADLHHRNVDVEKTKPYTSDDTAYREFLVKLKNVKNKMLTKSGKEMAVERHSFMRSFFERINREVSGDA